MPGALPPLPAGGHGNGGAELLSKVKLLSFTASPDHVLPFESSTLRWQVETPGGVAFSVDGFVTEVPAVGMQVVQLAVTSQFRLQARARGAEVTLGTITVSVDSSQCVQQTRPGAAQDIWNFMWAALDSQVRDHGDSHNIARQPIPFPVVFSPDVISYEVSGTLTVKNLGLPLDVNIDFKGSFGLMVDRSADRFVPTNEVHDVHCSVDWDKWVSFILGSIAAGGIVAALLGSVFSGFGAILGFIIGAVLAGGAATALLIIIINTVTSHISSGLHDGIPEVVQVLNGFFHEPPGMAMAAVDIVPTPVLEDGTIAVTYCPSASGGAVV